MNEEINEKLIKVLGKYFPEMKSVKGLLKAL